jgi:predicted glycosyltransferase
VYSHDAFGLGQLRRCRAIAHALVACHESLNVLILTGSPIIATQGVRPPPATDRIPGLLGGLAHVTTAVGRWSTGGHGPVKDA